MIKRTELTEIGRIHKPHGIVGEMSASFEQGIDPRELRCIVLERDGIFVPFFIDNVRPKGADTVLITIEGFRSEVEAAELTGSIIYGVTAELPEEFADDTEGEDGMYASDLMGYTIVAADGSEIGLIEALDDRTENYLFCVHTPDGRQVLVPVADEFITDIDSDARRIEMDLPDGFDELM